jgi:hypothetical protein
MAPVDATRFEGMKVSDVLKEAADVAAAGTTSLAEAKSILELCLQQDIGAYRRGRIHQEIWQIEQRLGQSSLFFSQAGL